MYDARNLRRFVISRRTPSSSSVSSNNSTAMASASNNNNNNNNADDDNNDNDGTSNNINNNGGGKCSIHVLLPRMAAYSSAMLLLIASFTVLFTVQQENQYMTSISSVHHDAHSSLSSSSSSSSSSSLSSYLHDKGMERLCAPASSSTASATNMMPVVETMHPPLPTRHNWSDFLEGPALDAENNNNNNNRNTRSSVNGTKIVACKFRSDNHSAHFPHALQQLYRCVSWWNYHRELEAAQMRSSSSSSSSSYGAAAMTTGTNTTRTINASASTNTGAPPMGGADLYLIWPPLAPKVSEFLQGFLHALRETWDVHIVKLRGQVPVVRAKVQYGYHQYQAAAAIHGNNINNNNNNLKNLGYQTRQVSDLQQLRNSMVQLYDPQRFEQELEQQQITMPTLGSFITTTTSKWQQEQQKKASEKRLTKPKITILNRHVDSGRSILNAQELLQALQHEFLGSKQNKKNNGDDALVSSIELIPNMDAYTFYEQMKVMVHTDILISPHGAQLSSLFLMPKCGAVLELFGRGYLCPEFFASLAAASGIRYAYVYTATAATTDAQAGTSTASNNLTTATQQQQQQQRAKELAFWMKDLDSRKVARLFPMCAPIPSIVNHVRQELMDWRKRMENPGQNCL